MQTSLHVSLPSEHLNKMSKLTKGEDEMNVEI